MGDCNEQCNDMEHRTSHNNIIVSHVPIAPAAHPNQSSYVHHPTSTTTTTSMSAPPPNNYNYPQCSGPPPHYSSNSPVNMEVEMIHQTIGMEELEELELLENARDKYTDDEYEDEGIVG